MFVIEEEQFKFEIINISINLKLKTNSVSNNMPELSIRCNHLQLSKFIFYIFLFLLV